MKTTKWYPLLIVAVALLLFSGMTPPTPGQASASASPAVTPTATECAAGWSVVPSPNVGTTFNQLHGVAALSASDVWAVGYEYNSNDIASTLVEHWDGSSWSVISSPNPGTNVNTLQGVAARSASDVWAVGNTYGGPLTEHWNGSSWSVVPSPNPTGRYGQLYSVAALSPSDAWAVGYSAYSNTASITLVEHWDGSGWSVVSSPSVGALNSVAAISFNDVWAVGSSGTSTLTEHWDGTSWSVVASPNPSTSSNALIGVTAISSNNVWAVGDANTISGTLIEHWDGTSWSVAPSPNVGANSALNGVAATSSNDVWAAGQQSSGTLTEHWDGGSWRLVPSPTVATLFSVAAISSNDVWAVGYAFNGSVYDTLVEHYSASPCGTPTVCPVPFVDIAGNVFYNAIAYLYCRGDLNGTDQTHYSPALTTTRAQFAKVVVLAFGITSYTPSGGTQDFTDVPPNYFAYGYIESGFHAGILGGYDANSCAAHNAAFPCYLPNVLITRGQVTKLVVSAAHYPLITPTGGNPTFTDVPPSNVFFANIETAHAHGVINGYNDNTFRPNNSVRRDEMAQIVYKGVTTP